MTTPVGGGMVACSGCGEVNREHARFCSSCGAALARRCPACGNELDARVRFCDECGASTDAPASSSAPVHVAEARKVVTIVFADLAGSTALQERMDPESVRVVMQRYYAAIRDVVEARGGRIVKFIGDGAMAVFGIPETNEEDALRALDAALALHEAFESLEADVAREWGASIALRVGVNTGEVVVSSDDADVVGDVVNLAARLERAAASGSVLVGETTWRLTRGRASFGDLRELHVAGKADEVHAWPLIAIAGEAIDPRTDLVGRGGELAALHDAFAEAVRTGTPRLVTVLGSPGVGKTRLASELERVVAGAATVLAVRCTQQTAAPLAPVADMLHAAVAGSAADPDATVERLGALLGDDIDRGRVLRTVAAIVGNRAGTTPEETLWALRLLVEQRARVQPVVLFVDDLQWAEAMLLDLVEHLAEWTRAALLLVVTARPELRERRAALADGARHAVVALEGLDRDATEQLACEILGARTLPPALLERLPASTGGNPLFVREMLRMLVDDDVLRAGTDGTWELRVAPDAIDVPPTIQSLLAARLDRLTTDEQLVLERAAVWGTEFPLGALVELVPPAVAPRVESVLELLRRRELIESAGSYWIDEPVHRFHHVLIRDAAYRRMLRDVRASLHERLAAWVETKTESLEAEYDELVGHHLEQAYLQRGELGPPDAQTAALGRSASARLGAAAQRALDRDDPSAAPLAARALACLPVGDPARADVLLVRCDALLAAADAGAARDAVAELEEVATSPRVSAWAACFAAQLATITDPAHLLETEQRAAKVAAELTELGDARGAAKAHAVHAGALARLGRFGEVEAALDRALTSAREAGDRRLATVALAAAPVAAVWGPSPVPRAGGRCLDVVRLLRITAGSPVVEATSLRCQAVLEAFRGRFDAARRLVGAARDMVEELGLVHGLLEAELFAGIVELGAGDLDGAGACLRIAYDGLRALGADADAARAGALLARVALERGDTDEAERLAREAERLAGDDLQAGISWRRVQAEVLARRGAHEEARALAEAAVAIASRTDALVHHADACAGLAAVRRAAGDVEEALQAARDAAELYERKGATALAQIARASFDSRPARDDRARAQGVAGSLRSRATSRQDAMCGCFARRDWDALDALVAPDYVLDDRRALIGGRTVGRAPARAILEGYAALGIEEFTVATRALRGDRLVLAEFGAAGRSDSVTLAGLSWNVMEVGADGLIASLVVFDDMDSAYDELDRRYIEGEGASAARVVGALGALHRAYNRRDWGAVRDSCAPDAVLVDHRPASWPTQDREGIVRVLQDLFAPDARMMLVSVDRATPDTLLGVVTTSGHDADGAPVEWSVLSVAALGPDGFVRLETFAVDRLDDGLGAYRRLTATVDTPTNRCVEAYARYTELFANRDWAAMSGVVAERFQFDDRRPLLRQHVDGPVDLQYLREVAAGGERFSAHAWATRGDRLALLASEVDASDAAAANFSSDSLLVVESDETGVLLAVVVFPTGELAAAVAELDRRFIAGEGAPYADLLECATRQSAAVNARDWAGARREYAPEVTVIDHFTGGWSEPRDADAVLEFLRSVFDTRPGAFTIAPEVHALRADTIVCSAVLTAAADDGDRVELAFLNLMHYGPQGIDRVETFPPDRLAEALAAYRSLGATGHEPTNRCVEVFRRWADLFAAREWDSMTAVVADDFGFDDRRPVTRWQEHGAPVARHLRLLAEEIDAWTVSSVAVRGERVALVTMRGDATASETEAFAAETRAVIEIDESARFTSLTAFPSDDILGAYAELDRRFIAGEGALYADLLSSGVRSGAAINARDWAGARLEYASEVTLVDHYTGGWGEHHDADGVLAALRDIFDAMPGALNLTTEIHALRADAMVCDAVLYVPGDEGERVELFFHNLMHLGPHGFDRIESWPADRLDDALAAFHALGASRVGEASNECTRLVERWADAFAARDWDALASLVADDFESDDRRAVVGGGVTGREAAAAATRFIAEQGADGILHQTLAVRGKGLALLRLSVESADDQVGLGSDLLVIFESRNDGRLASGTFFDDLDTAIADLDDRYLAGEGEPFAAMLELVARQTRACNARDWEALRALYAPGIVTVNAGFASGWGTAHDRDALLGAMAQMYTVFEDARVMVREVVECGADAIVCSTVSSTLSADGAATEIVHHIVYHRAGAAIDRMEIFDEEHLDDARAAYRRLTAGTRALENRCTTAKHDLCRAVEERDWETVAGLFSELHFEGRDRRRGMHSMGGDDPVESYRVSTDLGVVKMAYLPIAVRGESLALGEESYRGRGDGALEVRILAVNEVDSGGRIVYHAAFEVDDVDAAVADLEERYLAGEGRSVAPTWSRVVAGHRAANARDWDAFAAGCTSDIVWVDRHYGGWTDRRGRDAYVETIAGLMDPFPESRAFPMEILAISEHAVAYVLGAAERSQPGDASPQIVVLRVTPAGFDRSEAFPDGERAAAMASFERLAAIERPANGCTRAGERLCELHNRRDWDGFGALFSPNFDGDDYRRGFVSFDADPVKSFGTVVELTGGDARLELRPVAVRGERLALSECRVNGSADELALEPGLFLTEVDGDERFVWMASYDIDARERAIADLDARSAAADAVEARDERFRSRAFDAFHSAVEALVRGDRDTFAEAHSPALRCEDRRSLMARVYGRDEMVADFTRRPDEFRLRPVGTRGDDLELHHAWYRGTSRGAEWEFELLCVAELGPDGRIVETVNFDADDLDAAYAELDRRYLEHLDATSPAIAAVWRVALRWRDAFNARDWSAMRAVQASDLQFVDHTTAGYGRADRKQLESLGTAFTDATPDVRMRFEHVDAITESAVALAGRTTASNEAGGEFENNGWNVLVVGDGTIRSIDVFPRNQLAVARARFAELG